MAPTESTILTNFLLPPAPLPAIITLKAFTEFFPKSLQSSPQIKLLYRDLQHQRALTVDQVRDHIALETRRGEAQKRIVGRARRDAERVERDDDVEVEGVLFGPSSNLPAPIPHTLKSILPDLASAAEDIEDEIRRMDEESDRLLEEMKGIVGGLSDLRHGKFANDQLREQVLEGLQRLEESCVESKEK